MSKNNTKDTEHESTDKSETPSPPPDTVSKISLRLSKNSSGASTTTIDHDGIEDHDDDNEENGNNVDIEEHDNNEDHVQTNIDERDEEESAYSESGASSASFSTEYGSDEVVDEAELSDSSGNDEDYEEEYQTSGFSKRPRGRPPKNHKLTRQKSMLVSTQPPSGFYPHGPIMPPLIAATIPMFAKAFKTQSIQSQSPTASPTPATPNHQTMTTNTTTTETASPPTTTHSFTASQLQEITKATIQNLASPIFNGSNRNTNFADDAADPSTFSQRLPLLLPRNPKVTSQMRANVSSELKQNLATMLTNPIYRQALLAQLAMQQQQQQQHQFVFRQYRPTASSKALRPHKKGKYLALRDYEGDASTGDENGTIASRRPRRTPRRAVNYAKYFKDDEDEEDEVEEDDDKGVAKIQSKSLETHTKRKHGRRGRPRKSTVASEDDGEEDEDMYETLDADSEDTGPSIEKILSKRINKDTDQIEYLVKWSGLSYLHVEWISKEEAVSLMRNAGTRLSRFEKKSPEQYHYDSNNIFNPAFCIPERIVYGWTHADQENHSRLQSSYLVKWTALPIEDATWEKDHVLKSLDNGPFLIEQWEQQPTAKEKLSRSLPPGQRPDFSMHETLQTSFVYKGDNTLRPYQLEGLNWVLYCWFHRQSCIIADEMGLGKTVQSIAFLDYLYTKFNVLGPFLIVAPLSTLPHWEREFAAWSSLKTLVYHGSAAARDLMYEYEFFYKRSEEDNVVITNVYRFDVLLTTYEMALAGEEHLRDVYWRVAVFDEAHRLKNKASRAAEILKGFRIEHKLLLTGTPLQNNLEELWSLLNFLQPQRFADEDDFRRHYGELKRSEDVVRLQGLLKPLMLRRLKEDVEKSIPVKEETIVEVELTSIQKRYYRAILERNFGYLCQGSAAKNAPSLLNTMMELRKCCIHPYLITGAEQMILDERGIPTLASLEEKISTMIQASGKLVLLDKLLARLREGGHRVLIFSQMTRCLDILADYLRYRHYPYERIDGSIKGEERQAAIDRFCDPKMDSFVFLLCTRAGGVGINLTAADTVIIYDSDWNPQNDIQAQARCHRIGQTKSVKIYRLLTRNTYEREMFDRAGLKLGLDRAILGQKMAALENLTQKGTSSGGAPPPSALDRKEVELLLKKGAYGLLMEDDEDAVKFCEESIDQILERRTTVIKHGLDEDIRAKSSIFSKASFAATADEDDIGGADIDIDDPNFWEHWAKKMRLDPSQLLQDSSIPGRGMALLDEPRIKRMLRRIRNESEKLQLQDIFDFDTQKPKLSSKEWSDQERIYLLQNILTHGLSDLKTTQHPNRSYNELLASARFLLRDCLDQSGPSVRFSGALTPAAHDEAKFKEDFEKLVIGRVDTEPVDVDSIPESDKPSLREFPRSEIPFQHATRSQIFAYKSFMEYEGTQFADFLLKHSKTIVLRVQLYELIKQFVVSNLPSDVSDIVAVSSQINMPPVPGSIPREWWTRDHDAALMAGVIKHGLRVYDAILKEQPFANFEPVDASELDERLLKLLSAVERRSRATAKAALHTVHEQRKRISVRPTPKPTRRRRRIVVGSDESSEAEEELESAGEEYVEPEEEQKHQRAFSKKKQKSSRQAYSTTTTPKQWSRRDRNEFMRVVGQFGIPPPLDSKAIIHDGPLNSSETIARDWTTFNKIANFAVVRSDSDLNEFTTLFIGMCKSSTEDGKKRKRGSVEKDFDEDDEEHVGTGGSVVIPIDRARKSLQRIRQFASLRSWLANRNVELSECLTTLRRSSGLPRWWIPGAQHDLALLMGVAKYGLAHSEWIIGDRELSFWPIYESSAGGTSLSTTHATTTTGQTASTSTAAASTETETRPSRRRASKVQPPPQPTLISEDTIKPSVISWPNETVLTRRFEMLIDTVEQAIFKGAVKPTRTTTTADTNEDNINTVTKTKASRRNTGKKASSSSHPPLTLRLSHSSSKSSTT